MRPALYAFSQLYIDLEYVTPAPYFLYSLLLESKLGMNWDHCSSDNQGKNKSRDRENPVEQRYLSLTEGKWSTLTSDSEKQIRQEKPLNWDGLTVAEDDNDCDDGDGYNVVRKLSTVCIILGS